MENFLYYKSNEKKLDFLIEKVVKTLKAEGVKDIKVENNIVKGIFKDNLISAKLNIEIEIISDFINITVSANQILNSGEGNELIKKIILNFQRENL
jgi:hypothetical protein